MKREECSICGVSHDIEDLVRCEVCDAKICENEIHSFFKEVICRDCAERALIAENSDPENEVGEEVLTAEGEGIIVEVVEYGAEKYAKVRIRSDKSVLVSLDGFRLSKNVDLKIAR